MLRTVNGADIKARPIRWLMRHHIPLGALTLVVGDGGLGKTTWCLDVAAQLSHGLVQGDLWGEPVSTLMLSVEDDASTTLKPRLVAAGGDVTRCEFLAEDENGLYNPPRLPDDQEELAETVKALGVRLVILDPLVAFLGEGVNSYKTQDVRGALGPVAAFARKFDLAVVGIMHLNKKATSDPSQRFDGSKAFRDAARSALVFGADPDDPRGKDGPRRVIAQDKANLAPPGMPSRAYETETVHVEPDGVRIETYRLNFVGEHRATASDLLAARPEPKDREEEESHPLDARLYEACSETRRPQADVLKAAGLEHNDSTGRRRLHRLKDAGYLSGGGREGWFLGDELPPWLKVSPPDTCDTRDTLTLDTSVGAMNGHADTERLNAWGLNG